VVISELLKAGAKIGDDSVTHQPTPLMYAASSNPNPSIISVLLKGGAKVGSRDLQDRTPLMFAAASNTPEVISVLLQAGATVDDEEQFGMTALMIAAEHNPHLEVISALVKAGAKIDFNDDPEGTTPLMLAAQSNSPEIVSALLRAGADAALKSKVGRTAYDYAANNPRLKGTAQIDELQDARRQAQATQDAAKAVQDAARNANPVTASNWTTHPFIVAIRAIVTTIDSSIAKRSFSTKSRDVHRPAAPVELFDLSSDTSREAALDPDGIIRRLKRSSVSESGRIDRTYYYDQEGRLRFVYVQGSAADGTHVQDRIYFDVDGARLWEIQKVLEGRVSPYPKEWPARDIVFNPKALSLDSF
jgi:hypothetical protein